MAADVITFFEHQFCAYEDLALPTNPVRRERVLEELERVNRAAGREILRLERKGLRATEQVGIVSVGEITFQILPKIDEAVDPGIRSATRNLLAMLSYAYDLQLTQQTVADASHQPGSWFELLTRLFVTGLFRQILSGLSHQYIEQEETLPVLRGRWNVQRQLQRHPHTLHAFDVGYEEFSPDHPLNQVFRYTVEQLSLLSQEDGNRDLLNDLRAWFSPVTLPGEVSPAFLDKVMFTRLNERFLPSFNMARLFLSGNIIQLSHGDHPLHAFLFDMNALFERFVAAFLAHHRKAIFPKTWQSVQLHPQGEGTRLYLATSAGKNAMRLRPDLLFKQAGQPQPLLVADTKYKRLDPDQRQWGVSPEDVYQMLAYAVRLKCPRVLLLYPQPALTGPLRRRFEIESASVTIWAQTIDLHRPLSQPDELIQELSEIFHAIVE